MFGGRPPWRLHEPSFEPLVHEPADGVRPKSGQLSLAATREVAAKTCTTKKIAKQTIAARSHENPSSNGGTPATSAAIRPHPSLPASFLERLVDLGGIISHSSGRGCSRCLVRALCTSPNAPCIEQGARGYGRPHRSHLPPRPRLHGEVLAKRPSTTSDLFAGSQHADPRPPWLTPPRGIYALPRSCLCKNLHPNVGESTLYALG
jgi:hypothetical protein